MPRFKEPDPLEDEFKPSLKDAQELSRRISPFQKRKVGLRTLYPFELFLESLGIIRFNQFGDRVIRDVNEYKKWIEINDLREWKSDQDLKEVLATMPEEKAAYDANRETISAKIREIFRGMKIKAN